MASSNFYKNLIFTNHALNRMKQRSISADSIWRVLQSPEISKPEGKQNTTKFIRTINQRQYQVIGTYLPKEKKTLIVSVWVRGEEDKVPLVWQIVTAPFKVLWWIVRTLLQKLLG